MICTEFDAFAREYRECNPSWVVHLASGIIVYQDDGRPDVKPISAWERLRNYCIEHNDYITDMHIRFRCNVHHLPSNADGYFFSKGVRGGFGMPKTHQLFFVGALENNKLLVTCWKTPEMFKENTEERNPEEAGICLIAKNINHI